MRFSVLMSVLIPAVATAQTVAPNGTGPTRDGPGRTVPGASAAPDAGMGGAAVGGTGGAQQQVDADLLSQQAGGSMLRASAATPADSSNANFAAISFFSVPEPKPHTIKKHDLVTIIVDENSQYSSNGSTALQKEADFDAKVTAMVRLSLSKLDLSENSVNTNPEVGTTGTRDFTGTGAVNRTDTLTTRLTAEVLDVKPNGTLVLQARQHIKTDDEEQTMVLSGTCRVEDVTPDNTVLSTQMFDKDVSNTNKGAVRDSTKRGWVPKLLDAINPF
jgi:flagellar L-ring protein precursor FlgH